MNKLGRILRMISYLTFGLAFSMINFKFTDPAPWILLGCMIANSIGTMMEFWE